MAARLEAGPTFRAAPVVSAPRAPTVPGGIRQLSFYPKFSSISNFSRPRPQFESRFVNIPKFSGDFAITKKPTFSVKEKAPQIKVWNPFNMPMKSETLVNRVNLMNGLSGGRVYTQKPFEGKTAPKFNMSFRPSERGRTVKQSGVEESRVNLNQIPPQGRDDTERRIEKMQTPVPRTEKLSLFNSLIAQIVAENIRRSIFADRLKQRLEQVQAKRPVIGIERRVARPEMVVINQTKQIEEIALKEQSKIAEAPKADIENVVIEQIKLEPLVNPKENIKVKVVSETKSKIQTKVENMVEAGASAEVVVESMVQTLLTQKVEVTEKTRARLITKVQQIMEEYEVVKKATQQGTQEVKSEEFSQKKNRIVLLRDRQTQKQRLIEGQKAIHWIISQGLELNGAMIRKYLPDQTVQRQIKSGLVRDETIADGSWAWVESDTYGLRKFESEEDAIKKYASILESHWAVKSSNIEDDEKAAPREAKKVMNGQGFSKLIMIEDILIERQTKFRQINKNIEELVELPQAA